MNICRFVYIFSFFETHIYVERKAGKTMKQFSMQTYISETGAPLFRTCRYHCRMIFLVHTQSSGLRELVPT